MKGSLPIAVLLCTAAVSHAWDLKPDPPADKPWAFNTALSVPLAEWDDRIIFADGGGPFMLVLNLKSKVRRVYDLRTGERAAEFECGNVTSNVGEQENLSPGGTVWASGKPLGKEVRFVEVATGKERGKATLDETLFGVGFVSDDRLVAVTAKGKDGTVRLFDTATAAEVGKWPVALGTLNPAERITGQITRLFAVSGSGKYLAVVGGKGLLVHALADGKKLAELELPPVPGRLPPPTGLAFSADGSELAAVVGQDEKKAGTLLVWSLADGKKTEYPIERWEANAGRAAAAITPIRSGGWLIDGSQVWANGKPQRLVPNTRFPFNGRLAVTPEQVVGVREGTTSWTKTVSVIDESTAVLSPAKDGILAGAKEVPTNATVGWSGAVKGYSTPFGAEFRQVDLKAGRTLGLVVALDGTGLFVETVATTSPAVLKRVVRSENFSTGKAATFELPPKRVMFGEAATSESFLTIGTDADGMERLEFHGVGSGQRHPWRPHPEVKPNGVRSSVLYAATLTHSLAVTVGNGRVTRWVLPDAEARWTVKFPEAAGGGLSPDGKVIFVSHPGGVRALDVETGSTLGNLKGESVGGGPGQEAVAVSGDGKRLATLSGPRVGCVLRVWDLTDGTLLTRRNIAVNGDAGLLRFFGSRFLLVGESILDLADPRVVWKLKPAGGVVAKAAPADGRVWFAWSEGGNTRLHAAAFPADHLARFITDYDKTDEGVFQKGEKVKVVIEPPADAPPGWDAQARTAARLALSSAKLTEDAKATTVVTVTFSKVPDTPVKLKWQGVENLGKEETIHRFAMDARAEMTRDGQVVYTGPPVRTAMRIKEWPAMNEIDSDSKTGQEFFTRQVWRDAAFSAGTVFYMTGGGIKQASGQVWRLPGEATLTADGLKMNWPAGHQPPVGMAVEGDPSLTRPPVVKPDGLPPLVLGAVCMGLMVAVMVVVLVLALRWQRRRWEEAHPRRPYDDEEDDDDRPRRARRRED